MQAAAAYEIKRTSKKIIVTLDREMVDEQRLTDWLNFLRLEHLIQKANFGSDVEQMGEEMLSDWWEKNKARFIPAHEL